jgi:cobalt-zinc-cadmium efflux system outer membrane protein
MIGIAMLAAVLSSAHGAFGPREADGAQAVSLEDVLRMAAASPLAEAIEADLAVAEADEHQARLLPNPQVEYQGYARLVGTPNAINGQQHQIDLGIPLLLSGQRRARMRSARLRTAAVRAGTCVGRKRIQQDAAARWLDLLTAQEQLDRLSEGRVALEAAEELTRARAARGAQTEYDAERVGHELRLLDSDIQLAQAELHDASRGLATLVGRPSWTPRAEGTLAVPISELSQPPDDIADVPAVDAARRSERVAEADVTLARKERWPVPTLSGGTYVTTDGGSASMTFGVALPLPLFDRGQAQIARARAELRRARASTRAVEHVMRGEIERARAVLRERQMAAASFGEEAHTVAPRLRAMAHKAYEGGVSSVLELIDAERTYLDARLREVDLGRAVAQAAIELEAAQGTIGGACR